MANVDEISSDSVFARSEHVVSRTVDGEEVIVEPQNGMVNVISTVGSRVWALLDASRSVGEIADIIADEYDIGRDQVLQDCLDFLQDMRSKGLVD